MRTPEGEVIVDTTGKKAGRGAYLCPSSECWALGIGSGKLERSLRVVLSQERRGELMKLGEDLTKERVIG